MFVVDVASCYTIVRGFVGLVVVRVVVYVVTATHVVVVC